MKGPSLDAIRRFKEQQERKKREEDERKVQDKLTTLEHRAAQGDKKAKSQLKQIEKAQEDRKRSFESGRTESQPHHHTGRPTQNGRVQPPSSSDPKGAASGSRKPKVAETDFEELMRLAKKNTNEVKVPDNTPKPRVKKVSACIKEHERVRPESSRQEEGRKVPPARERQQPVGVKPPINDRQASMRPPPKGAPLPKRPSVPPRVAPHWPSQTVHQRVRPPPPRPPPPSRLPPSHMRRGGYYQDEDDYDDEDEDEYEEDGFVVNEADDEVQDELKKTLKSIFRYDKRRCDLREQELDRQYRAIGNVSTFEDLEREERRASRLAASEDARALREEEERKRLKKIRLRGMRD